MLNRLSLTIKMVLVTFAVGLVVWSISDWVQSRRIKKIFFEQLTERLQQEADESKMAFFAYINSYSAAVKIIASLDILKEYAGEAEKKQWSQKKDHQITYYGELPPWLPKPSVLRSLFKINCALLLDQRLELREVYRGLDQKAFPRSLLQPSKRLLNLSHGQNYMTEIDGMPYIVRSEFIFDAYGKVLAALMAVSSMDADFFLAPQSAIGHENLTAIVERGTNRIRVSSHPALLAPGSTLDKYKDRYMILGKTFFDYGSCELQVEFASFISTERYESLTKEFLHEERRNRAIGSMVLIISFIAIMLLVTGKIRQLTKRIMDFSEKKLGVQPEDIMGKDELYMLDNRFRRLTQEVDTARAFMNEYAESLRLERDRAQNFLDIAGSIIMALNPEGEVTLINKKGCVLLEYEENELLGKNWFHIFDSMESGEEKKKFYKKIMMHGDIASSDYHESVIVTRSGKKVTIAWHTSLIIDDTGHILGTLSSGEDITERKLADERMRASLKEKEVLLHEIHHRVKNNIQVISSLLNLQSDHVEDSSIREMFMESRNRIKAMALIHEKLYSSTDLARIDFKEYINTLIDDLIMFYDHPGRIILKRDIENISLNMDTAIPCGLIINELISNSLKYAFPDKSKGEITITFKKHQLDNTIQLVVQDNGKGIPSHIDFRNPETLGLQLVLSLSEGQLEGRIELKREKGTEFIIVFPVNTSCLVEENIIDT